MSGPEQIPYRHTEQSDFKLNERRIKLQEVDQDWQNAERREAVRTELCLIAFEQIMRYSHTHVADELVEDIDNIVATSARCQLEMEVETSWKNHNIELGLE